MGAKHAEADIINRRLIAYAPSNVSVSRVKPGRAGIQQAEYMSCPVPEA